MVIHWISERFNFYTALGRNMVLFLWLLFGIALGFLTTWFLFDDLGSDVQFFVDEAELEEMHWNGLRRGPQ